MAETKELDAVEESEAVLLAIRTLRAYYLERKAEPVAEMTYAKLAKEVGIDAPTLNRLVNGDRAQVRGERKAALLEWARKKLRKEKQARK